MNLARNNLLVIAWLLACLGSPLWSPAADNSNSSKIYDGSAIGSNQIAAALAIADREDKNVLLQFGGDWCAPCIKLHNLLESDQTINRVLKSNYEIAHIEFNKGSEHLARQYHAAELGLPFVIFLDGRGKRLRTENSEELLERDQYSPAKILSFLNEWTPKAVKAKPIAQWVRELVQKPQNADASVEFEQIYDKAVEAVPALIEVIRAQSDSARDDQAIQAYRTLGALGELAESAVPFLAQQFTRSNHLVQFAADTLPKLGPHARMVVPGLINILNDPALNQVSQEPTQRADPRSWLLFNTALCIAQLEPSCPRLVPAMLVWLKAPNLFCKRVAPQVLGQIGTAAKSAIPALVQSFADPDETVRERATNAIIKIGVSAEVPSKALK
jgi:thiol-disulfide isomerase/thioredoxin